MRSRILGTGSYLPEAVLTNFDLEKRMDTSDAWIRERTGIERRHIVAPGETTVDMAEQARFAMEFCAIESCGKCTPCRIGSTRGVEMIDRIRAGIGRRQDNLTVIEDLCDTMKLGSLCALGGFTPYPVMSALTHFPEDFGARSPRLESVE